jgi:hypothetical protein
MVQEVLQADWHDAWHSPHALPAVFSRAVAFTIVLMCFILHPSLSYDILYASRGAAPRRLHCVRGPHCPHRTRRAALAHFALRRQLGCSAALRRAKPLSPRQAF